MQTFDFIIVGSGSAGSVVAEKLSASGRFSVLVLEAGGTDRRFYVQMPLGYGKTFFDPAVNWNYKAEPDPGLGNNADHWPRGKLLGGSSSINGGWAYLGRPLGRPWGVEDMMDFLAVSRGGRVKGTGGRRWANQWTRAWSCRSSKAAKTKLAQRTSFSPPPMR